MTLSVHCRVPADGARLEVDCELPLSGCTAVFGPSGAGKSSLLRAIAGFIAVHGRIAFRGTTWLDSAHGIEVPPHRRDLGYVSQRGDLFGHLDVRGNLRYAQQRARGRARLTFAAVVEALDLGELLERRVATLSGGERQRVALARALLTPAELLLLDEPLSALDNTRKLEVIPMLERIRDTHRVPMLYVSHSVDEVVRLADSVVVLGAGRVLAAGATADILERLDVQSLTGHFDAGSVVHVRVESHDETAMLTRLRLGDQPLSMPMLNRLAVGDQVRLRIRSRDVALAVVRPAGISIRNVLTAMVTDISVEPGTPFVEVLLDVQGVHLRARITREAVADLSLREGQGVFALVKSVAFDHRVL